jgi:hypothetical protein
MWSACVVVLNLAIAATYIVTIVISVRSKELLRIEPLLSRVGILGMTIMWPFLVFLLYGFLVGYSAS